MKKIIILIIILLFIAGNAFSDFQIGPYILYKFPINKADLPSVKGIGIEDFWFGLDTRLKIKIFQLTGTALYHSPAVNYSEIIPPQFVTVITGGLSFDIGIIRFGFGAGPGFVININAVGMNTADFTTQGRVLLDFMFRRIALGISMNMQLNVSGEGKVVDFNNMTYSLGFSLLFGGGRERKASD